MSADRNIAMFLTGPQPAAIAVVRLIGPRVERFLSEHFNKSLPIGRCVHGTLSANGQVIDDPLIVRQAEHADVNLHGGPWIVRSVLDLAAQHGFEVLDVLPIPLPGEATEGKTALEKAMLAVASLAMTELALQRLLEQVEAWESLHESADLRAIADDWELWWLLHPPRVAISGIPNSGKSTLANQLFGQQRSITSDLPGTTRDWVTDIADIDGLAVHLIDTPGVRRTEDAIESEAIMRAAEQLDKADLILLVFDATVPMAEQAARLGQFPNTIRVINKSDRGDLEGDGIRTIATSGSGIDQVRAVIGKHFHIGYRSGAKWWTMEQRGTLLRGQIPFRV